MSEIVESKDGTMRSIGTIGDVYYKVDRFGRLVDFGVELIFPHDETTSVLTLDDGIDVSDLIPLISPSPALSREDCEFVVTRTVTHGGETDIYHVPDSSTIPPAVSVPVCRHCGGRIKESLGTLYCTSHTCPERLYSRLEYYVQSGAGVPLEYTDLEGLRILLSEYTKTDKVWPKMFVDMIMPNFESSYGQRLYPPDTQEYLTTFYTVVCRNLRYYPEVESYYRDLVNFILSLSIPGLTRDDVCHILTEVASVREHMYAISALANRLRAYDDTFYDAYIEELQELSARILQFSSD